MSKQAIITLVALALLTRPISPQAQSLADVARAEAARRSAITQSSKTYTNKDLGRERNDDPRSLTAETVPARTTSTPQVSQQRSTFSVAVATCVSIELARCIGGVRATAPAPGSAAAARLIDSLASPATAEYGANDSSPLSTPAVVIPPLIGWNIFTMPKTPDEIADELRLDGREDPRVKATERTRAVLPPGHQLVRTGIGLGYVQGADWATEISAVGKVLGLNLDLTSFLTMGHHGLGIRSGRLSLVDPERGWGLEAGQLFTDLRGLARGARASWHFANFQPTMSFYQGDNFHQSTLAYRDELRLSHHALVGGEVASDGSFFARAQSFFHKLGLDTYYRKQPGKDTTHDRGFGAAYDIWNGVTLRASVRTSTAPSTSTNSSDWRLLAVRVPFGHGLDLTLERNWLKSALSDSSGSALGFHLPAGPFQIFQRYQWGDLAYKLREVPIGFNQRQMQTVASYKAARWLVLGYQVSTEWFADGRARQWDELRSSFPLTRNTNFELITAMPNVLESSRFRFKFSHKLTDQFTLLAEYGRISAFQQGPELASDRPRFLVTVKKEWNTPTPARGGELAGSVLDANGDPMPGVVIRLGSYGEVTDQRGHFAFENMPTGSFDFTLDKDTLPADYAYDGSRETISIARSTRATRNLVVVPLRSLTGRVYCDENHNGRYDPGEEVAGAVMRLNASVTSSDRAGRYGFYNLSPGRYVVEIVRERLPQGLTAKNATVTVELEPDRAASGLDFVLIKVDKPLILQELN